MKNLKCIFSLSLFLVFFLGCTTTYRVQVDALAAPESETLETFILEAPHGASGSRLRYNETAELISKALVARGWALAEDASEADVIVSLAAQVSAPLTETQLRTEPLYYRTWGGTRTVSTPVRDPNGNVVRYVRTHVYVPSYYGIAGYGDVAYNTTVYEKALDLIARDGAGNEVWTIRMRLIDSSSDLRKYLPMLASASLPYIGETTQGEIVVKVSEKDETLAHLRGVAAPQ